MKRFLTLSLTFITLLTLILLPSCSEKEPTPYELIKAASEQLNAADAVEANIKMDMTVTVAGTEMEVPVEMNMALSGLKSDNMTARIASTTTTAGTEVAVDIYVKDGIYYMSQLGMNYKVDPTAEGMDEIIGDLDVNAQANSLQFDLPEEAFKEDVVIVKNEDGTRSVALNLTDDEFMQYFSNTIDGAAGSSGVTDITVSNTSVTITVNEDGSFKKIDMSFDMSMSVDAGGVSMESEVSCKATYEYTKIGDGVTVEPIEGYESFEDISSLLG